MQLSIRWKLIISIVFPLVFISGIVMWIALSMIYSYSKERLHEQAMEQARHYAARFDGQFQTVAQVARSTAAFLETQQQVTEQQLYDLLRSNVNQNPLIYGSAIAFKPFAFNRDKELFSPYVYRSESGLNAIDIGAESYNYTDGQWEWYTRTINEEQAIWTEPYFDIGAGNILMDTFSVPFYKDGKLWGVATIDIPLDILQKQAGIEQLQNQPFVIVSPSGKFISHHDPSMIMSETIQNQAEDIDDDNFKQISNGILNGENGLGVIDGAILGGTFGTGPVWIFDAPIKSTGWSFATAVPESEMTSYVRTQLSRGLFAILIIVCLVTICILLVSTHLTKPIRRLAEAVTQLGQGNLETNVANIKSSDEIGQLANGFNRMVTDLNHYITAHTKEIAARESVENELRVAREIQASL